MLVVQEQRGSRSRFGQVPTNVGLCIILFGWKTICDSKSGCDCGLHALQVDEDLCLTQTVGGIWGKCGPFGP